MNRLIFLILCASVGIATTGSTALAQAEVKFKPSMQWYTVGAYQSVADSSINPDNAIFKIEDRSAAMDLRPNLKAEIDKFQLVARPQLRYELKSAQYDKKRHSEHGRSTAKWIEAYGIWAASDKVLVSLGLQNYQWGAAETLNPSNRIFHETADSKGLLYTVQGRNIMRVNVTWNKSWNTVFMAETDPYKETPVYQAEEEFQSKSMMKHEFSWSSGSNYAGVVLGAGEADGPWVGEYLNQSITDGLTIYGDASHQRGSAAWYPVEKPSLTSTAVDLEQSRKGESKVETLAVGGLRYSFEGGSDLRFEYVLNTAGWNRNETELGHRSIDVKDLRQIANIKSNAARWAKPGLEFRGQRYGLASLRFPDLFSVRDLTVYARRLHAFQDASASYYASLEYGFGEASTWILSGYAASGTKDSELRSYVASSVLTGLRQDF